MANDQASAASNSALGGQSLAGETGGKRTKSNAGGPRLSNRLNGLTMIRPTWWATSFNEYPAGVQLVVPVTVEHFGSKEEPLEEKLSAGNKKLTFGP